MLLLLHGASSGVVVQPEFISRVHAISRCDFLGLMDWSWLTPLGYGYGRAPSRFYQFSFLWTQLSYHYEARDYSGFGICIKLFGQMQEDNYITRLTHELTIRNLFFLFRLTCIRNLQTLNYWLSCFEIIHLFFKILISLLLHWPVEAKLILTFMIEEGCK